MRIKLLPLNPDSPYLRRAVAIYHEYSPGDMRYQTEFFTSHMDNEGYIGLVAQLEEEIVGVAFGSNSLEDQWWHSKVAAHVGKEHAALQDAWVLTQLNVLSAFRNRGIGTLLHDKIIATQTRPRLLLSTPVSNKGAQRLYIRYGWEFLHKGFPFFNGDEPYAIMCKELGER